MLKLKQRQVTFDCSSQSCGWPAIFITLTQEASIKMQKKKLATLTVTITCHKFSSYSHLKLVDYSQSAVWSTCTIKNFPVLSFFFDHF